MTRKTHYELFPTQYKFMFGYDKQAKEEADKKRRGSYQDVTLYQGGIGSGKCLGINTPVLMYNGTIKKVQDVVVGDLLLAPDGNKRTVIGLGRGKELMYRVIPNKGDSFTCNESHILTLGKTGTSKRIDISIKEYLKKSDKFKKDYYLIRLKTINSTDTNENTELIGFKIAPIGIDNYYGFTLLEGPHFLLGDFTITHNTFCGSLRGLLFAFKWAKSEGLVGAQSQVLLDNTTKAKYIWHLENMGLKEGEHYWWSDRKTKLTLANGSTIRFYTVSNWETFRSTEFQWIELEEASLIDEKTFKELMGRLRGTPREDWEDPYFSMFLHTNPQGTRGWIYRFFRNPKTKLKGYRCVTAPSTENTYLPESYVQNLLKLYSKDEVEELIMGLDVNRDNTIAFPDFSLIENVRNLVYDPSHPLILTCDFNYNPMCWYLIQQYDNKWFILKELIFENVTTQEMCEIIEPIIREQYNTKELIIMGDAHGADMKTNGSDYQIMSIYFGDKGYDFVIKVLKSNPFIKDRLAVLRGIIRNAKGERRLFVDESCKRLLYNFDECKNNLANGGLRLPTDNEIQQDDNKRYLIHPIDAISYPMYFLSKQQSLGGDEDITL